MFIMYPVVSQANDPAPFQAEDPLFHFFTKISETNSISYEAVFRQKDLFSSDTIISSGSVVLWKEGNQVSFFRIINSDKNHELVYIFDSTWSINHIKRERYFIGEGLEKSAGNQLSNFLPLSLFTLDSTAYYSAPSREVVFENEEIRTISLKIQDKPKDITGIRYEISIARSDSMIQRIVQDFEFGAFNSNLYQESIMYNYTYPQAITFKTPGEWLAYTVIYPVNDQEAPTDRTAGMEITKGLFLEDLILLDIHEKPFRLPTEGMAFIDLWYVGCFPCLKAAPVIESLFKEFREKVHFYSVNEVDKDLSKIIKFKESLGISFPVLLNREDRLAPKISGSGAYPAYFIMDCATGKVVWWDEGYSEDTESKIRKALETYL